VNELPAYGLERKD